MAYEPTNWENREVEKPRTYIMTENADGTVTLTPSEGQVFVAGTPLDAVNLNKMETQIAANDAGLADKISRQGDTMNGDFSAPIINATTALREAGLNLSEIYQAKGSYQVSGQYPTWSADPNGVKINMGKYAGTGKPVVLFLTSARPSAVSTEHRIWIEIDNF